MKSVVDVIRETIYFLSLPKMNVIDVLEIVIIAFVLYHIILWVRKTRAWTLLKGIALLILCYLIAYFLNMSVILWLFNRTFAIGITALAVVFQPELRKALEELGRKNFVASLIPFDDSKDKVVRFSDRSINEIIDSAISSQLLINIFEHNTPLHDGAVIVRNDRIVSATCYLPLSDNLGLSKELGTRHRAGVGISEVSDSTTIIVSEETGKISVAVRGKLLRNVDGELLKKKLGELQGKNNEGKPKKRFFIRRGSKSQKGQG